MQLKGLNRKNRIKLELEESFGNPSDKNVDIDLVKVYFNLNDENKSCIDERTWNDLDMDEVFSSVDRTLTKTGEQVLYQKLHCNFSKKEFLEFDSKVKHYLKNSDKRIDNSLILKKYNKSDSYNLPNILFNEVTSGIPKYIWVLSFLSLLLIGLTFINSSFFLPFLFVGVVNTSLHYYFKRNINLHTLDFKNLKALDVCCNQMFQNDNEKELLSNEEKKVLNTISKKSLFLSVNIDVSNEFSAILFYIVEIIKGIFLADAIQYNRIISLINKNSKLLLRAYRFVGCVDSAISVASLKTGYTNYVEPLFISGNKITALDVYHPLIADCKSNSIITNGSNAIITGGNMSGKTTFLKTIGVNVILAQTINFTFSSKFELPPLKLFSSIQNRDKLTEGISFFMDELLRTKQILKSIASSQDMHFILIDEIYRGTNSKDRITLASSVLNYLAKSHSMVFVTTHDLDIIDFVSDYYEQFYFDNRFVNNRVVFDYKIHQGVQKKTNVVELMKSLNFPKEIISNAIDYGSTFGSLHHFDDKSNTKENIRK